MAYEEENVLITCTIPHDIMLHVRSFQWNMSNKSNLRFADGRAKKRQRRRALKIRARVY